MCKAGASLQHVGVACPAGHGAAGRGAAAAPALGAAEEEEAWPDRGVRVVVIVIRTGE